MTSIIVACLVALSLDSAFAQSIWGLQSNDRFVLNVMISRETELVIDEAAPVTNKVVDRLELEYQVTQIDPSGNATLNVRVRGAIRDPGAVSDEQDLLADRRLSLLNDVQLSIDVAPDGTVEQLSTSDREALLQTLAGLNPTSLSVLNECCSEQSLIAWLARPFWFSDDFGKLKPGYSWDESDLISLGILGNVRTDLRIEVAEPGASPLVKLQLKGNGAFVPLIGSHQAQKAMPIRLAEPAVVLDEYSGSATLRQPPLPSEKDEPESRSRPLFDQLSLKMSFSGSCVAEDDQKSRNVRFRQTQIQSWLLAKWSFGGPPLLIRGPLSAEPPAVPIPETPPEPKP